MRVLLTGAFGNVGTSALRELLSQGHTVRCFDIPSKANLHAARRLRGRAEVVWGDLRRPEDLATAVKDQDVVIHLAFIIPTISATGVGVDDRPEWARAINVGGTQNLLAAMKAQPRPPKILFASSVHVYGQTQDMPPTRTADDPLQATDRYSQHKIECEQMVRASGLDWAILRFGVVLPLTLKLDPATFDAMFDVPLSTRLEFVHTRDVGLALANAVSCPEVWGRVLLIGGGEHCRFYYRDVVSLLLERMGVGMLPEKAFGEKPFCIDWLDTRESQKLLNYQHRGLEDYAREMTALMGPKRYLLRMCRPLVRRLLLQRSPYFSAG